MSKQSDMEFLSVQVVEKYASEQNMPIHETIQLFEKYQVFENMMIQHEYLHQVDVTEVMEYVKSIIESGSRQLVVYHGTVHSFDKIDLTKSHNRRDFGKGFYTTVLERQAKEWAYRQSLRTGVEKYYVYQYMFRETDALHVKRFHALDREWLEFIKENRSKGAIQHDYDVVIGPVADDNTMETVQLYLSGTLKAEEAVERLRYNAVNNQVSFHTEKALATLKLIGREQYE